MQIYFVSQYGSTYDCKASYLQTYFAFVFAAVLLLRILLRYSFQNTQNSHTYLFLKKICSIFPRFSFVQWIYLCNLNQFLTEMPKPITTSHHVSTLYTELERSKKGRVIFVIMYFPSIFVLLYLKKFVDVTLLYILYIYVVIENSLNIHIISVFWVNEGC